MQIVKGKVIEGDKRGRELGFPTANVALNRILSEGVYISEVSISSSSEQSESRSKRPHPNPLPESNSGQALQGEGIKDSFWEEKWLHALTFIGSPKTFGKVDYKAETYILDFDVDIYGQYITIQLLKKLRENKKFDNAESLIVQMKEDEKVAREWFRLNSDRTQ